MATAIPVQKIANLKLSEKDRDFRIRAQSNVQTFAYLAFVLLPVLTMLSAEVCHALVQKEKRAEIVYLYSFLNTSIAAIIAASAAMRDSAMPVC